MDHLTAKEIEHLPNIRTYGDNGATPIYWHPKYTNKDFAIEPLYVYNVYGIPKRNIVFLRCGNKTCKCWAVKSIPTKHNNHYLYINDDGFADGLDGNIPVFTLKKSNFCGSILNDRT